MVSFPATGTNLNSLLLWGKDFVQVAGRVLSPKVFPSGKRNERLAIHLLTELPLFMLTWVTKNEPSGGSILPIRSGIFDAKFKD